MKDQLQELLEQLRELENRIRQELNERKKHFAYELYNNRVKFEAAVKGKHRLYLLRLGQYLREARLLHILTAPVIWSCLAPAILMDIVVTIYQRICFPVYSIPLVRRSDFIFIDRHYLAYLNLLEKLNCLYCSYFNGVIAYVREVAGRTEQYWCPIKHARAVPHPHERYGRFFDYGDAEGYRKGLEKIRGDFEDLESEIPPAGSKDEPNRGK